MNIIIVGSGTVGTAICSQLVGEGHDITVLDSNSATLSELSNRFDVFAVSGSGTDISILRKAGAEHADLLIAVTSGDEVNILCCSAARKLGTKHTIARVRNPEYNGFIQLMKNDMNLSLTINPELAAAKEIYRMLRFPSAAKIDTCCHGRVELAEFAVGNASPITGVSLNELRGRMNRRFLVCGVLRGGQTYIPSGDFIIEAGDLLTVTAPEHETAEFFRAIGLYKNPVRNLLIVGGGRTTYYLEELLRGGHFRSTVVEKSKERCRALAEEYACTVICDDGMKQDVLDEEGIGSTDAFLALSDVDEENAIISLYAKTRGVPKIITKIDTISYIDFFHSAGLESIISPKSSTAAQILRYVRSRTGVHDSEIGSLHKLLDGSVEALEFTVKEEIPGLTGVPLRSLDARPAVLIACIVRKNAVIIPSGDDAVYKDDTVIIITKGGQMKSVGDILK